MTVNPGDIGCLEWTQLSPDLIEKLRHAYLGTFRGPHGDAPETDVDSADTGALKRDRATDTVPALLAAHFHLAAQRRVGETKVAVSSADGPAGFGPGLQVVTDQSTMLMDSVTVLLHRLGVAYVGIMNPTFQVRRGPDGALLDVHRSLDSDTDVTADTLETWIHIQLASSVDRKP